MSLTYKDTVLVVKNALSPEQCDLLVTEYDRLASDGSWSYENCPHAQTGIRTQSSFKKVNLNPGDAGFDVVHGATQDMVAKWVDHLDSLGAFHVPMFKRHLKYAHQYRLLCYEDGAKIHPHIDWDYFTHASCTFNLNDGYEGGEFAFHNGNTIIELEKGDGMIFPADHFWVHEVKPVTRGKRYSTNCFICSLPEERRQALGQLAYEHMDNVYDDPDSFYFGKIAHLWSGGGHDSTGY
jgi:hypothetical protein